MNNYYSIVYDLYLDKQYKKVLVRCKKAKAIFADNHIQENFDFLAAMAIGHTNTLDTFKIALENIIASYPGTEVSAEADRILALIKSGIKVDMGNNNGPKIPYEHKFNDEFHLIVVIPGSDRKTNKYKVDISDFNAKYYSGKRFNVSNILIDRADQIIIVKKFDGYDNAMDYYNTFRYNKDHLKNILDARYKYFLISKDNFVLFYKNKDINGYYKFFEKNFDKEL